MKEEFQNIRLSDQEEADSQERRKRIAVLQTILNELQDVETDYFAEKMKFFQKRKNLEDIVKSLLAQFETVKAIKHVREVTGCGLVQAKAYVDGLR